MSGGHSLLGIVESTDKFYMLGTSMDNAPGEVLDKVDSYILLFLYMVCSIRFDYKFTREMVIDSNCWDRSKKFYENSGIVHKEIICI